MKGATRSQSEMLAGREVGEQKMDLIELVNQICSAEVLHMSST